LGATGIGFAEHVDVPTTNVGKVDAFFHAGGPRFFRRQADSFLRQFHLTVARVNVLLKFRHELESAFELWRNLDKPLKTTPKVKIGAVLALVVLCCRFVIAEPSNDGISSEQVISNYLAAAQAHQDVLYGASMEVSIDASVPSLKKQGKLEALRKISGLGKITYKVLGFQGDDTIKNEVIARYLEAEQKGQESHDLAITPENYKFKFRGRHTLNTGQEIYVVFLTPRKKVVGLFKGEMWLDAKTYLPVLESGKFVKPPSIFFKRVEFVRELAIQNGASVPKRMSSTIEARLVGRVNLSVEYSHFDFSQASSPRSEPTSKISAQPPPTSTAAVK
jgi:hypothetical protein